MHGNPYESPQLNLNGEVPASKAGSTRPAAIFLIGVFVFLASLKVLIAQSISVFIGERCLYDLQPLFGVFQLLICGWLSTVLVNRIFTDRSNPGWFLSVLGGTLVSALFLQKVGNYYLVIFIRNALSFVVPVSE